MLLFFLPRPFHTDDQISFSLVTHQFDLGLSNLLRNFIDLCFQLTDSPTSVISNPGIIPFEKLDHQLLERFNSKRLEHSGYQLAFFATVEIVRRTKSILIGVTPELNYLLMIARRFA